MCGIAKVAGCVGWVAGFLPIGKRLEPFVLDNLMVDFTEFVFLQEGNDACSIPYVIL